jgi:hypothetical protein
MSYFMIDVETDGPIPGDYSMVMFGAVVVRPGLEDKYLGTLRPISEGYHDQALAISRLTRAETLLFPDPQIVLEDFEAWIQKHSVGRPMFISDNNGFDFMFMTWYFHHFLGRSPFGHSSTNLGSLYKGVVRDVFKNFKHLRQTRHTHNPVDDAMGNAEALLEIQKAGLKIPLE